ncbi:hypothetical protein CA85_44490 [Allorhodopirellula solitaria]|uniref:Uncharacterized protein n=1 Tax=Allorhodopirellula solitaria TaxID=2527987 RepID=A0A5C5WZT0_9BACT|nr:hypothetical protein CA85_44490 [Allorhodopirellula solitaria]
MNSAVPTIAQAPTRDHHPHSPHQPRRTESCPQTSSDGRSRLATKSTDGSDRREQQAHSPHQPRRTEPSGYIVDRRLRPSRASSAPSTLSSDERSRLVTKSPHNSARREQQAHPPHQLRRAEPSGYIVTHHSARREHQAHPPHQLRRTESSGYKVTPQLRPSRATSAPSPPAQTNGVVWLQSHPTTPPVASNKRTLPTSSDGRSRLVTKSPHNSARREQQAHPPHQPRVRNPAPNQAQTNGVVWLQSRPTAPPVASIERTFPPSSDERSRLAT